MRNPAVSASWPRMTSRSRRAALEFAGIGEDRAHAYSMVDWLDLPDDAKSALLRGWHMATIGGTTRRYRDTTRRVPVLTNSSGPRRYGFHAGKVLARNAVAFGRHRSMKVESLAEEYFASDVRRGVVKSRDRAEWVRAFKAGVRSGLKDEGALPNPTAGWAVTQDGETLKHFGPGTKGANAAFAWLHKRQGQSVDWSIRYSGYDIVNVEGGKVVYSGRRSFLKKLTNRSRRNGTKGAYPFKDKVEQYRKATMPELLFARKDAAEAARAVSGHDVAAENWYKDDYFTINDEIIRRRHNEITRRDMGFKNPKRSRKNPDIPDWMRSNEKFYTRFGFTLGRFQNMIRDLSETNKKRLHQMMGKGMTTAVVHWISAQYHSVKTNPVTKPYQVWGSHTYVQSIGRGGWQIYATYRTPRHAREDAEGIMKFGIPGVKGKVQALVLHASSGGFSVYWRPVRKIASNPAEAPRIWRKRRRGKRTTHFKGPDPRYRTYYVALASRSYPMKGRYWTASTVVDALPPTVVGKLYKIAARSKVAAIKEARGF